MGHGPSGDSGALQNHRATAGPAIFICRALSKAAQGSAVLDQVAVLNYISPSTAFVMRARNFGQIAVMT
jgi:hypothetical protein